jgi:hypothetical protein
MRAGFMRKDDNRHSGTRHEAMTPFPARHCDKGAGGKRRQKHIAVDGGWWVYDWT